MVVMGGLQMTLSFCGCKADAERPVAEFVQSKTTGLAALNDAIFPDTRSVAGNIKGGIYAERNRRFRVAK
jgi:hypothetical protein